MFGLGELERLGPGWTGAAVVLLLLKGMNSDAPIYAGLGLSLVIYVSMSLWESRGHHELPKERRR